jgi:hypothetical protein
MHVIYLTKFYTFLTHDVQIQSLKLRLKSKLSELILSFINYFEVEKSVEFFSGLGRTNYEYLLR